ncbi:MAG: hypothetical protein GY701_13245 [Sulfitobacter sp.]|nr:hypothetical protein [Sulfitobacter sp.]
MSDHLVGGADDLAAYFGMDTPEGRFQHDLAREIERLEAENEILRRGFRASRRKIASYRTNSSRLPEWCHAALAAAVKIEPSVTEAGDRTNG